MQEAVGTRRRDGAWIKGDEIKEKIDRRTGRRTDGEKEKENSRTVAGTRLGNGDGV